MSASFPPRATMPGPPSQPVTTRRNSPEAGVPAGLACAAGAACRTATPAAGPRGLAAPTIAPFALQEATLADLQAGMRSGRYTARTLCEYYLGRIEDLDGRGPALHSVIEVNPDAPRIAQELDAQRKAQGPRRPLHGIPVLVKDNRSEERRVGKECRSR